MLGGEFESPVSRRYLKGIELNSLSTKLSEHQFDIILRVSVILLATLKERRRVNCHCTAAELKRAIRVVWTNWLGTRTVIYGRRASCLQRCLRLIS